VLPVQTLPQGHFNIRSHHVAHWPPASSYALPQTGERSARAEN
jgi:hypothetical protein